MTENSQNAGRRDTLVTVGVTVLALIVMAVFFFTPIKGWLNQRPVIWQVLYPALAVFALVVGVRAIQGGDGLLAVGKWALLFVAGASGTVTFWGGPGAFLAVGKGFAIAFIVAEVLTTFGGAFAGQTDEASPQA